MTDKIREAFEKFHAEHLRKMGMDEHDIATERDRLENGDYQWSMAAEAWPYWQAAAALAQQPAPVAQEPVRELIGYACDRRGALMPDRCGECLCWPAYQDAPPAAEQLAQSAPDELRARCDGGTCGLGEVCENCMMADAIELAAEPDTVAVPRDVLRELADTAIAEWHDPSENEAAQDRNECLCCGFEDGHNADCSVAIALRLLAGGAE